MARPILDPQAAARLAPLRWRVRTLAEGLMSGLHRSPRFGSSVEFAEYKEYAPGDDPRHLDWRAWGRLDRNYVKRYEDETQLPVHLLVDHSASMALGEPSKLDRAALLAGTLAWVLGQRRDAPGLWLYAGDITLQLPPRSHRAGVEDLLSALEEVSAQGPTDTPALLRRLGRSARRRGLVVLLSDLLDPRREETLGLLRRLRVRGHDVALFHLVHPQERDFPFREHLRFVDPESGSELVAHARVVRASYLRVFGAFLEQVAAAAATADLDYQRADLDTPPERVLLDFLRRRDPEGRGRR